MSSCVPDGYTRLIQRKQFLFTCQKLIFIQNRNIGPQDLRITAHLSSLSAHQPIIPLPVYIFTHPCINDSAHPSAACIQAIMSHIHIYLSTPRSIHPQLPTQAFTCHKPINSSAPPIVLFHSCTHAAWCAIISLSMCEMTGLPFCSSLQKDITDVSGFLCLSNHPLIYHCVLFLLSLTALLCISDETRKRAPICLSGARLSWTSSHHLPPSGPFFCRFSLTPSAKSL